MTIELNIKYTKNEYKEASLEKVKVMPNLKAHIFAPSLVFGAGYFLCSYFYIFNWWSITLLVLSGLYALTSLLIMPFFAGDIAAFFASKKLIDTYQFTIDSKGVKRLGNGGTIYKTWYEFTSIDTLGNYMFLNLATGSMLLPLQRLETSQAQKLSGYVLAFNKLSRPNGKR